MVDFGAVLKRIGIIKGVSSAKDIAFTLGISPQDFSNRKKRGTLLPVVVEWALNENVNLNWLLRGETEEGGETQDLISSKINLILPDMDEEGRRDVLKYAEEKKQLKAFLRQDNEKKAA